MAVLSLLRAPPREARTDYQAWVAPSGMLILPLLMAAAALGGFSSYDP
jgi:hypothetical protein